MSNVLDLAMQLIRCPSVTPNDEGCQKIISERLQKIGFHIEHLRFADVDNLWARYGTLSPLIVFAGHTDVVPPGPLDAWTTPPFQPTVREGLLFGRGAADMKSGLAAMVIAAEKIIHHYPDFTGSLAFLITSNEEGSDNTHGTKKVIETLLNRHEKIDYCIIGEASSDYLLGDQIRIGRRGSLSGKLIIYGKQGHIAYPHLAQNPIHLLAEPLLELTHTIWDHGNEFFPATTFQISNIHAGTGANNVIPGSLTLHFNFRFSPATTVNELQQHVTKVLEKYGFSFDLYWTPSTPPFLTKQGKLIQATQKAIKDMTKLETILSTGGGTSDGRFIAPTGAEVIELGPCNATAHQINECVRVSDLELLARIYQAIVEQLFLIA